MTTPSTRTVARGSVLTPASMSQFRTCPATGRRIHRSAERLIKVNAVVAIVALLVGAIAALLLVLTRWQPCTSCPRCGITASSACMA